MPCNTIMGKSADGFDIVCGNISNFSFVVENGILVNNIALNREQCVEVRDYLKRIGKDEEAEICDKHRIRNEQDFLEESKDWKIVDGVKRDKNGDTLAVKFNFGAGFAHFDNDKDIYTVYMKNYTFKVIPSGEITAMNEQPLEEQYSQDVASRLCHIFDQSFSSGYLFEYSSLFMNSEYFYQKNSITLPKTENVPIGKFNL